MNECVCVYVCGYATYSLCPHMAERARGLFGVSFYKSITAFLRAPLSRPNHLPKTITSKYHHVENLVPTRELYRDTNSPYMTVRHLIPKVC